jgi:hypothetical protein
LKIFEHRNRILQKALLSALQLTNLDGTFFPLNDALKEKDYTSNELVTAVGIAWDVYGQDTGLLVVARKQDRVILSRGGAAIAAALNSGKALPSDYPYRPIEYTDGVKGNEGGVSILRLGTGADLTTLISKYTSHGLSHGHFDKLTYNLFDKGNEILTDYGSVRFIGVEQKYGGRYLPENDRYASQTIAHNTITVDGKSHFNGDEKLAEKHHAEKFFSDLGKKDLQVIAARDANAYKDVLLQRTVYLLQIPGGNKLLVDLFAAKSGSSHQYDLPFHYDGHLISTSFKYSPFTRQQQSFGNGHGYQFLWKEAEAMIKDTIAQLTFLNDRTYYTISTLVEDSASLFLVRTGANDPNFNLRHEPGLVIRKNGSNTTFLNVVEIHGRFDPIIEFSTNAYTSVKQLRLLQHDDLSVVEILVNGKKLVLAQSNTNADKLARHTAQGLQWTGPYAVWYGGKKL